MPARVLQQLVGAVEAQWLAVDQAGGERGRVVALQPAAGIGQQGEAGGGAFRKAVIAEALDLLEQVFAVFAAEAVLQHPGQQLLAMRFQPATALPRGHRAAQGIGLARGVAGRIHRQLHHLFLEQRHAQGAREHALQLRRVQR
ncbi:hypothetical protein G6F68_014719 [Rhizopus microsporus]|nr:hypothetical protein G6F68_014719 [Rhizopus microsporus]